jgi:rubrerythrin
MFRRRPIIRREAVLKRSALEAGPRQMLITANQLKETGKFAEAADIYERLANGAEKRGMLLRAPHLFMEAAQCRLMIKQSQSGVDLMWRGFRLLEKTKRWPAILKNGKGAVARLQRAEQLDEANKLQTWLDQILKDHPEAAAESLERTTAKKPYRFPPKCPHCGASIRLDEVEWIDEGNIECPFCGSTIQPEG